VTLTRDGGNTAKRLCKTRVIPLGIVRGKEQAVNYQPGSPSVYLEGINQSAAPRTPLGITPWDERLVGCRYRNRQLFFYTPR